MKNRIIEKLNEIERTENIRILLAVESGSRAWGFASTDSDYDVRFIYVREKNDYLRLEKNRDVIELPIDDELDINGWDLDKALKLLHKSNPTLFEWFSSPIIYKETDFGNDFKKIMNRYFSSKNGLYHYLSMAKNNYREYMREDMVKAKKYFYVLRPVLACRWILDKAVPPPMLFSELMDSELKETLKPAVNHLLDLKINSPEIEKIRRVDEINEYIEMSFNEIENKISLMPKEPIRDWKELDELFLSIVGD